MLGVGLRVSVLELGTEGRVEVLGFEAGGLGFGVWSSGLRVQVSGFMVRGLGFRL